MVSATAFVVRAAGAPFEQCTVELDGLRPNEVLIDLKATGICHTDIAVKEGKIPVPFPVVLGHEGEFKNRGFGET
jgi:aryl-alcohol dehydrogenase